MKGSEINFQIPHKFCSAACPYLVIFIPVSVAMIKTAAEYPA